jgi:hypothetical protein
VLLGLLVTASLVGPLPTNDRIARVELWLKATLHHRPGSLDEPAASLARWSHADIETLSDDLGSLILLMRRPGKEEFQLAARGARTARFLYTPTQMRWLNVLACAAGGMATTEPECLKRHAASQLDDDLSQLEMQARQGDRVGAENYVLKRGALLQTDVALFTNESRVPVALGSRTRAVRVEMSDGEATGVNQSAVHWNIARLLLDAVWPSRSDRPAPGRDRMVRDWYVATATWMQLTQQFNFTHLKHARELFRDDEEILFLSGCEHETYAGPAFQTIVRTAALPPGVSMGVSSDAEELREAASLFREALAANPSLDEARLRLARVLSLQRRFSEAEQELNRIGMSDEPVQQYYTALFRGFIKQSLSDDEAARQAYESASIVFPTAQSPLLALAALARARGRQEDVRSAMAKLVSLGAGGSDYDPWWEYHTWQARDAGARLEQLWRPFVSEKP